MKYTSFQVIDPSNGVPKGMIGRSGVTFFTTELRDRPLVVAAKIQAITGTLKRTKVFARKCKVQQLSFHDYHKFYETNHIQGCKSPQGITYGLYYEGQLMSCMSFKKSPTIENGYELSRYASISSHFVIGGFKRLLTHFINDSTPALIYSFADSRMSDGGVYKVNGFTAADDLGTDYCYYYQDQLHHKFGFRLKRFRDDPALDYIEGLTEDQLAELNGLKKVYLPGLIRYILKINPAS